MSRERDSMGVGGQDARDLWRGVRSQPFVTSIAGVAGAVALARQLLLPMPELFRYGEELGELLYDLSLATLAAWIFNLLVVVVPRLRAERLMLARAIGDLQWTARSAHSVLSTLERATGVPVPSPLSQSGIELLCRAASPHLPWPGRGSFGSPKTLSEYMQQTAATMLRRQERLEIAYVYLPTDLVVLLQGIRYTGLTHAIDRLAARPTLGSLNVLSRELFRYALACDRVAAFISDRVDPMLQRSR